MARTLVAGVDSSVIGGAAKSKGYRQTFADLIGKAIGITTFWGSAAAAPGVQAAASLYGEPVSQIAKSWAAELELAAVADVEFPREAVRERYRIAVQKHFGKTDELNFTSSHWRNFDLCE